MSPVKRNPDPARLSFGALKTSPAVDPKPDHSRRSATESDRFEALASGPLKVPKSDGDKKRKKS